MICLKAQKKTGIQPYAKTGAACKAAEIRRNPWQNP
jgi:hypothetical protein